MNNDLVEVLDLALESLQTQGSNADILEKYELQAQELEPLLNTVTDLDVLRPVEMPDAQAQQADRRRFLAAWHSSDAGTAEVGLITGFGAWFRARVFQGAPGNPSLRKEPRAMSALLLKVVLIFSVLFSLGGGTVALADNSLPDTPLYPLKLEMEQIRLGLTDQPQDQAGLHLALAEERVQEILRLAQEGQVSGPATQMRLQLHLTQALQLAAHMDDEGMAGVLTRAQQMLRFQEQTLFQAQQGLSGPPEEPLRQTLRLLTRTRMQAEEGLLDGNAFRWRWRHGEGHPPEGIPQPDRPGPGVPGGNPDCPGETCEPQGQQHQYGPGGDGECQGEGCEPQGEQHHHGPQPGQGGGPPTGEGKKS